MKKYDLMIGNPPYDRSLHLKIIEAAIKHLTDDGKACYIHPARWIEDPIWKMKRNNDHKKYEKSIVNHIEDAFIIKNKISNDLFKISFTSDLMITKINKNIHYFNIENIYNENILNIIEKINNKIISNNLSIDKYIEYNKIDGYRVKLDIINPISTRGNSISRRISPVCIVNHKRNCVFNNGYDKNNKYWTENITKNKYSKKIGDNLPQSIKFKFEKNADNFVNSVRTNFYKNWIYLIKVDMHTPLFALPYIIDDEHGEYDKPWTNEDYCKYFDLTEEESKFMSREVYDYREKDYINYYEI